MPSLFLEMKQSFIWVDTNARVCREREYNFHKNKNKKQQMIYSHAALNM
jgi:hypothetical protein